MKTIRWNTRYLSPEKVAEKHDAAVQYLMDSISDEEWREVLEFIQREGKEWSWKAHFGFGMRVRNCLLDGKIDPGIPQLDDVWSDLVEGVMEKKFNYRIERQD